MREIENLQFFWTFRNEDDFQGKGLTDSKLKKDHRRNVELLKCVHR